MAATRPLIVLHPRYMDEVKSNPHLDFELANRKNFFEDRIPGFEPFHSAGSSKVVIEVIRIKLTQALGTSAAIGPYQNLVLIHPRIRDHPAVERDGLEPGGDFPPFQWYGRSILSGFLLMFCWLSEWKPYNFVQKVPYMVARLSSLVFLGEKICRDQEWINVSVNYTIDAFTAARELRLWPSVLRPLVHWFLPSTQKLREHLRVARAVINREVDQRAQISEGKLPPEDPPRTHTDALDWFRESSEDYDLPFDQSRGQVGLSLAAIHTTSNLLTNIMYDLAAYPEYIQPLRDEICAVAAEDGVLKKTSLLKLKLMDSVMKESQRVNPVGMSKFHSNLLPDSLTDSISPTLALLNRLAKKKIPLSDGTVIPKGATVAVSTHIMGDETIYPNSTQYDGYRFYNMRQEPGNEHKYQLVTTTREHFAFGHGIHACPGRFFAANESKIMLIHLLLKYDWMFKEDRARPKNLEVGTESITDPTVELLFRSREPEIDLKFFGEGVEV